MKYIRTANNIYKRDERYNEIVNGYIACIKGVYVQEKAVINQADTIEKLCDRFVCVGGEYRDIFTKISDRSYDPGVFSIYGAIWTDKGLIYVAKMNKKGEFELL